MQGHEGQSSLVGCDTLVISSGGVDGIAFLGCLEWLEQHRPSFLAGLRTVIGTSCGAIVGLFVALGMSAAEMRAWVERGAESADLTDVDVEGVLALLERFGVDDGARVEALLRAEMDARLPHVGGGDATFAQLRQATGRTLIVCAANLERRRGEGLGPDSAPDMPVLLGVRASFAIPILFTPVTWRGCTYVDGWLFDHCPVRWVPRDENGPRKALVLCIVQPDDERDPEPDRVDEAGQEAAAEAEAGVGAGAEEEAEEETEREDEIFAPMAKYVGLLAVAFGAAHWRVLAVQALQSDHLVVRLPSLFGSRRPVCRFSLASMSLQLTSEAIERYMRHGLACCHRTLADQQ